ncbi:LuxR C-terminal-related transcriptional regulator [Variovorax sp. M-6]|uniref:LuxR C-terminal-related transcriptional regulator n=1 Tax=Variovorax sp. M-6 TaxID=3233041 RepID=UPI003F973E7F
MSPTLAEPEGAQKACPETCGLPALPVPCIDRTALMPGPADSVRMTTVVAPAGYGKTTLMSQWFRSLHREGRGVAWLSLGRGCNGLRPFLEALCRSLVLAGLHRERARPAHSLDEALRRAAATRPFTLFIDNLHHVPRAELGALLHELLQALPARCQLVVASRARLPFELGAMIVDGSAADIPCEALRFDDEEALRYLANAVSEDELATVQQLAEGWPVALRVCRDLALQGGPAPRPDHALADALCTSARLRAYFDEEILRPLPAQVRDFVVRLSVLDEITADLAECLTESPGGAAILETLWQENLFIAPVDGRPLWLRYHRLFAAHLRARHPQPPESTADLHRKIAAWLLHRGLYAQALPHICAVGDVNFIARLLIASGGWCLLFRGGATVARILHSLPLAVVRAYPSLEMARIYRLVHTGEITQARQCFEDLKRSTDDFKAPADDLHLTQADGIVMELLLSLYEDRTLGPQALIKAEAGLSTDLAEDAVRSSVIRELLSWSFYHAGSFHKALSIGQESVDLCARAGIPYVQIYAYLAIGLSELAEGHIDRAAGIYAHAQAEATRCFGDGCNQVMAAQILGAEILYARNQVGASRNCTAYWREAVADGDGWVDLYASLYRTLSSSMRVLGDGPAALAVLEQARHMARSRRLWRLDQILQNHQLREACLSGDMDLADRLARVLQSEHPRAVSVQHQGWRVWYTRLLALARHALGKQDFAACAQMLQDIDQLVFSGTGNHSLCRLERDLLEARMLFERGSDAYVRPLSRALMQAAEAGLVRPVLDEGPVMLRMLRQYAEAFSLSRAIALFLQEVQAQATQDYVHPALPSTSVPVVAGPAHTAVATDLLSKREADVLALICDGLTSKEIARRLAISVNTVLTHRKNLYRKLCATTRSQLITIAREQQVLRPSSVAAPYAREA